MKKKNTSAGFTLVELMTVIAIMALLSALVLGLAGNAQKTAARKRAASEVEQLSSFVTDYQMEYGRVPSDTKALSNALAEAKHSLTNMTDPWGTPYKVSIKQGAAQIRIESASGSMQTGFFFPNFYRLSEEERK